MKQLRMFFIGVAILSLAALCFNAPTAFAGSGALPPGAKVQGMTIGEWHAAFWQAVFATPTSENPLVNPPGECYFTRIGNIGLSVSGMAPGTFSCEMPVGMQLYVLVVGAECSTLEPYPWNGSNEEELTACAQTFAPDLLEASIDGIPVKDLSRYTALSDMFEITVPEDNPFGIIGPATGYSVALQTGFITTPLTPGQHTIHVHGLLADWGFDYDWTYNITVKN